MPQKRIFREGAAPVIVSRKPEGWVWVDLAYSDLPQWRRLHAVLADGRVVMPAMNVFESDDKATAAFAAVGRVFARMERGGHLYCETILATTALRSVSPEAVAEIDAIAELCRATVAGEIEVVPIDAPAACGAS